MLRLVLFLGLLQSPDLFDELGQLYADFFQSVQVAFLKAEPTPAPGLVAALDFDCVVRTEQAASVRVYVGPSREREVIVFLPATVDFIVQGRTTGLDGSVWYRLDTVAVARSRDVDRMWVAAADVAVRGDCERIPIE